MPSYQNSDTVTIHSAIADPGNFSDRRGAACSAVWYLARHLDPMGSGRVVFTLEYAAETLGKSIPTVRRYLKDGKRLGFFRRVVTRSGVVTVYYSSLIKVGIQNGLMQLGAFTRVHVSELKNLKFIGLQLIMQALQEASRWLAWAQLKRKTVEPEEIVNLTSLKSRGVRDVLYLGRRCVFVSPEFTMFGVSLKSIAKKAGRSFSTAQRRLSNLYREQRGVLPVAKKQLAQAVDDKGEARFLKSEHSLDETRFFQRGDRTFRSGCTVYDRDLELRSGKYTKYRYKRAVAKELNSEC